MKRSHSHSHSFQADLSVLCYTGWPSFWWLLNGFPSPTRLRHEQSGLGVMFRTGIMGREMVGPFRIPDGVKMAVCVKVPIQHFLSWYKKKSWLPKWNYVLAGTSPSHAAKNTTDSLEALGIKRVNHGWTTITSVLNLTENLWSGAFPKEEDS